jgi:spermidine synthase
VYALLELGIGLFGVIVLFAVPIVGGSTRPSPARDQISLVLRAVVASICLLPPTLLMGATLPAIARWVETTPKGVSWLGYFYGGNLAGAVAGSLLAGFYLLRVYDMPTATAVAVALNVVAHSGVGDCGANAAHRDHAAGDEPVARPFRSRSRGSSTSPSRCPDSPRSDRKSSGRGCSHCSSARRHIPSR